MTEKSSWGRRIGRETKPTRSTPYPLKRSANKAYKRGRTSLARGGKRWWTSTASTETCTRPKSTSSKRRPSSLSSRRCSSFSGFSRRRWRSRKGSKSSPASSTKPASPRRSKDCSRACNLKRRWRSPAATTSLTWSKKDHKASRSQARAEQRTEEHRKGIEDHTGAGAE